MCGFVSFWFDNSFTRDPKPLVVQGTRLIQHRGPDDEAFYFSPNYCAGFRRLSIIDLSDSGRQPMTDRSERYWIVFNGEIYNYKEIRKELVDLGHDFKTLSDTEVLLAAYIEWGPNCLPKLNGMFAFVVWDSQSGSLFGARDRFGEKPLFYAHVEGGIVFGSEIKGLVPFLDQPIKPNEQILSDYLIEAKIDHSDATFFEGIFSLPASHQFSLQSGRVQIRPFWSLNASETFFHGDEADAVDQFRSLLEDSMRLRLRSDVPIGTCLSGGMDSGSLVCLMAKMLGTETFQTATRKTFTAHYSEFDESRQLDDVERQAQCESFRISPRPENLDSLRDLLWYQDEPFQSYSVFSSREVMRKAKQENVKVLINGQGADEILAGYSKFQRAYLSDLLHQFHLRSLISATWNEISFTGRTTLQSLSSLANEEFKHLIGNVAHLFGAKNLLAHRSRYNNSVVVTSAFLKDKQRPRFRAHENDTSKAGRLKGWLIRSMFVDNLPLYLRTEDRNSMSFSLESRLPFLDHRIAEFVLGLPTRWLMKDGKNKWLLRAAMQDLVPVSVTGRRKKLGFPIPDAVWQTSYLRDEINDLIHSKRFTERGVFDANKVHALFHSLPRDIVGHPTELQSKIRLLFRVVSSELWLQEVTRYQKIQQGRDSILVDNCVVVGDKG